MSLAVEINNLTKDYEVGFLRKRKVRALDSLTLNVERGEIFGFLGANGAGKTTTLKLLMRLMYPTSGGARILGRDIGDTSMHARIGYLPEHPYFYDYLTARELLEYCAELFGYARAERRRRASDLLARVRLEEKAWNKQLRKFSKGMLQRVGLAQALVNDPAVVFLDEPMSGLDPVGRREVRDLIASLRTTGTTVFLCSHILSDVEVLCDRAAILRRGRLAHIGRLEELRGAGTERAMEVVVSGADAARLETALSRLGGVRVTATPGGARVEVRSESEVDEVLRATRAVGARLVAVQPVGNALEELFVSDSTVKSD
ncbi:MAG: type transport system ATP-binding protein [Acidobacteriota bacterium]|jgi:ABC-2 type transport system ATP-binding protein|nr:type transport system ATP-binding protein [Acidobacteriota bacterium]